MNRFSEIEEAAAFWLIRREEAGWGDADEVEFQEWLQGSVAHKAAFWRLEYGWRQADRIGSLGLGAEIVPPSAWRQNLSQRKPAMLAACAALIMLVGIGLGIAARQGSESGDGIDGSRTMVAKYDTEIGKQKTVALADGSKIQLNTTTSVRTAVSSTKREVWLDTGEAFFDIAHVRGRPFVVHAGARTITVLGTKFSVRREGEDVSVSVVEGRVQLGDANAEPIGTTPIIAAGDMALSKEGSILFVRKAEGRVADALAWRDGMLILDDVSLAEAAAEFNRYNKREIVAEDPKIANLRIGGRFQASNSDAFLRLLRDAYGLQVTEQGGKVNISEP